MAKLQARVGIFNGWPYVSYRRGGPWGRHHYGGLIEVIYCALRVKFGRRPLDHLKPYGKHL